MAAGTQLGKTWPAERGWSGCVCTPLTRWQRYEPARQTLMQRRLEDMAAQKLSKDLFEIVNKSLAG